MFWSTRNEDKTGKKSKKLTESKEACFAWFRTVSAFKTFKKLLVTFYNQVVHVNIS